MMVRKYQQFRNWCFQFMGQSENEGYTSDTLRSLYQEFKKGKGVKSIRGVPNTRSAAEVLKRDSRFKRGDKMESYKDGNAGGEIWVSSRVVWFLNPDNE
jgi:hypothetical protein